MLTPANPFMNVIGLFARTLVALLITLMSPVWAYAEDELVVGFIYVALKPIMVITKRTLLVRRR
ncbi:hypothetical protein [Methylocucumis oryzae]|uniref:hypothetical protein n=1 Tax=Methylocucumis oryzae TaxID=1632867 RepID=UPI001EF9E21E|nr:hypothetical protein [Methylocucumis oryzae]